jgi:thiol-disulfide isomerase/thioredoxin
MPDKVLILIALSVIIVMLAGTATRMGKPQPATPVTMDRIMRVEPPRPLSVATVAGPAVVTFWATWCTPCLRELPTFLPFKAKADKAGINLLAIAEDKDGAKVVQPFVEQHGLGAVPMRLDADNSLSKAMGVRGLPTTLILNSKGEEVGRVEGETDWSTDEAFEAVSSLVQPR